MLFLSTIFSPHLFAQTKIKKVELIHANSLEFDEKYGKNVKRLIGNVQFKHEGVLMFCDSAYLYPNNSIDAFGNISIRQGDTLNLSGEVLKYNGNTKMADIQKNIRLSDKEMTLTTQQLFYDLNTFTATYTNEGTIVSSQNTLISQRGYYYAKNKSFSFKKNVVLTNPEYVMNCDTLLYNTLSKVASFYGPTTIRSKENFIYCENGWYDTEKNISQFNKNAYLLSGHQKLLGDSIYYDRKESIGKAFRNVMLTDTSENIVLSGEYGFHDEQKEKSFITQNALLKQYKDSDTLFLHADTLMAVTMYDKDSQNEKDSLRSWKILYAYHHVKFFKEDLQGKCDSLIYSYRDSTMRLFQRPVLWSETNQLTAEKIEMKTSDGKIERMFLLQSALIVSKEDSVKYNQIRGKQMTGYFQNNELKRIFVEGNGQTIYFPKDRGKLIGVNKAECSDILIFLKENKVNKITFLKKPDATLFPMSEFSSKEFILKEFIWRENERPLSYKDIFLK